MCLDLRFCVATVALEGMKKAQIPFKRDFFFLSVSAAGDRDLQRVEKEKLRLSLQ